MHDDDGTLELPDLQGQVEEASNTLATAALLEGPKACGRTASDLGYAMEEAVRTMGLNKGARPDLAEAVAHHVRQLAAMVEGWI